MSAGGNQNLSRRRENELNRYSVEILSFPVYLSNLLKGGYSIRFFSKNFQNLFFCGFKLPCTVGH